MTTWRTVDFTGDTWPTTQPSGELTMWVYDTPTGLLVQKLDAEKWGPTYTYTSDGRPLTRTWARGVVTTYRYDPATRELLNVTYSNEPTGVSTPPVTYTYDRLGRPKTVKDALTDQDGVRTFTYRDEIDLQLDSEAIVAGQNGLYSKTITRDYADAVPGRNSGFHIGTEYAVGYQYDDHGRINRVSGPGLPAYGAVYSRLADSDLVEYVRYNSSQTTTLASVRR